MIGRWKPRPDQWFGDQILGDRESQQDAYATCQTGMGIGLVLADGMGGHRGGSEAAQSAVSASVAALEAGDSLEAALHAANEVIAERRNSHDVSYAGMGTTLVIAKLEDNAIEWISVGDSPLWLLRNGALMRLNRDHSLAPVLDFMAQNGEISEEEAAYDPRRNQLRSALSGREIALIDHSEAPVPLKSGDHVLLASDGLLGLPDHEIVATLQSNDGPAAICAQLLGQLRETVPSGLDNSTAIVYTERKRGWL
ncbi:MAG: protein phosphatase 2C domain-containing protein [Pseudomonadota bacterium]